MSERMMRVIDADWTNIAAVTDSPLELLLGSDTAVYVKVRRDSEHVVYRRYKSTFQEGGEVLPLIGFDEDAIFLRLSDDVLAEICVSRSCFVSKFSAGGFAIPRPRELVGHTLRRMPITKPLRIDSPNLQPVDFDTAIVVDRSALNRSLERTAPVSAPAPDEFTVRMEVREGDLYVLFSSYESLRRSATEQLQQVEFPFPRAANAPGLYWMFQAAYALNERHILAEADVLGWLRAKPAGDTFKGKRGSLAAKFVRRKVNRFKGRAGRESKCFKVENLEQLVEDVEMYTFGFGSDGLKMALGVSEWWSAVRERNPDESRVSLAIKLLEQNFDITEARHLVYLISGQELSDDEDVVVAEAAGDAMRRA